MIRDGTDKPTDRRTFLKVDRIGPGADSVKNVCCFLVFFCLSVFLPVKKSTSEWRNRLDVGVRLHTVMDSPLLTALDYIMVIFELFPISHILLTYGQFHASLCKIPF